MDEGLYESLLTERLHQALAAQPDLHPDVGLVDGGERPLAPHLKKAGAQVFEPLHGLSMGQRLAWYGPVGQEPAEPSDSAERLTEALRKSAEAVSPQEFIARGKAAADHRDLYSWWVDQTGAEDLSRGLGLPVASGLIYAGLAGATRWPSGKRSTNTLWLRVTTMHLGGNHEFSTFRRTLGAILAETTEAGHIDEEVLTQWMNEHLRVIAIPYDDGDTLGRLERIVLDELEPPLNLQGMHSTPVRQRLKELRHAIIDGT